jgi:hypothetical protein
MGIRVRINQLGERQALDEIADPALFKQADREKV